MMYMSDDTWAVVVHHKNYDRIGATVETIVSQGVAASHVVIVDNSEEPESRRLLAATLAPGSILVFDTNRGYGAAVNLGVAHIMRASVEKPAFVLVATHEVNPLEHAIASLRDALLAAPAAAAAGPTLISGEQEHFVWSMGGELSRILHLPRHRGHREKFDASALATMVPTTRTWLDGAFVLYRAEALEQHPLDESFFLYMEETELHIRLGRSKMDVIWVPSAIVWQSSNGIPGYYLTRNLRLFYRRIGQRKRGVAAVAFDTTRRRLSSLKKRNSGHAGMGRGLVSRLPRLPIFPVRSVRVLNPLGGALRHYSLEMESVFRSLSSGVTLEAFDEPSISGSSRLRWVRTYLTALRSARRDLKGIEGARLMVVWPVLGYLDLVLMRIIYRGPGVLIIHDPKPLVRAIGYDQLSRFLGSAVSSIEVVVHSESASEIVTTQSGGRKTPLLLPHPLLQLARVDRPNAQDREFTIRVLGQYKPERDIDALTALAKSLGPMYRLEIQGRGWPEVSGWKVDSRFLSEQEMDEAIGSSDVVVIPYSRFFQSGIAIRALEAGVPAIGPSASSLSELYGPDSKLLVADTRGDSHSNPWAETVVWAAENGKQEVGVIFASIYDEVVASWRSWTSGIAEQVG